MKGKNRKVPMESTEQVERIKEMLPNRTEGEIYEALKDCKMDSNDAAQRLLSQEEHREMVPTEGKEKVKRIKKMVPRFSKQSIWEMLKQCNMDSNLAIQRLLSQELEEQCKFSLMLQSDTSSGDDASSFQEMPSNSGSLSNNFSSPPSSVKPSVTCQMHSVSLDKGKEVFRHMEDKAATASRINARASHAKGSWSSHAVQAGSDPMALKNNVASSFRNDLGDNEALGSSEFLEYKLFPPPTQQFGISLTLNDLVANTDQPSELHCLLRSPFLNTPSVTSRSSAAGSQHPQTSTSECDPSEGTPSNSATSGTQPFWDPQDPVLDAPFARSKYGPIQRPGRMSESGLSEATTSSLLRCSNQSTPRNSPNLPALRYCPVNNAQPLTSSASIHQSPETLILGNNMSTGHGFTHPYIKLRSYDPQCPLQHSNMDGCDNMHRNFRNDMSSAQQEVHQGGSSSRANANADGWGSILGGSTPHQYQTNSPAPSDISRTCYDSALPYQAQHQQRNDHCPAGMQKYNNAAWNYQPDSEAMSALPELQHGGFPGRAPLPAIANNQQGEGSSLQYAYRGHPSWHLPETSIMPNHQQQIPYEMTPRDLQDHQQRNHLKLHYQC